MGTYFVRWCSLLRCRLYASNYRTKWYESNYRISYFESESAISVLAGWLILGQTLSARELTGCAIVFLAIVLAQLPWPPSKILKKGILWTEHLLIPSRLKKVTCAQISFYRAAAFLSPFDSASQKHGTSSYKWHAKPHKHTSS